MRPHVARIEVIEASRTSEGVCADDRANECTGPRADEEGKFLPTYRPLDEADPALVWSPILRDSGGRGIPAEEKAGT